MTDEEELRAAIRKVLESPSRKKLVVAGPGTGKTTLFKQLLSHAAGDSTDRIVLTFINALRNDLEAALHDLATVSTLHAYALGRLHSRAAARSGLSSGFQCMPGLARLIARDWELIDGSEPPHFVGMMRDLLEDDGLAFYLRRGNYYDAVDFDDCVYRLHLAAARGEDIFDSYELVLVDEYQDFNALEAAIIEALAVDSSILVAGDDDQALYSQLRASSRDHIRALYAKGEYEVFELPFCMRCPKVVVDAVNDVLKRAQGALRLAGRIEKPYRHFPPVKGADSEKYPKIVTVFTSVQRKKANYMGRYVAELASTIPAEEVDAALAGHYPALLVIAPDPYRAQIVEYLEEQGLDVETRKDDTERLTREHGLRILKVSPRSNVGWRILLEFEPRTITLDVVKKSADCDTPIVELLPEEVRERLQAEIEGWVEPPPVGEEGSPSVETAAIRVTSFEGAKGLSAQHVVIAGLHDGDLPHDSADIKDLEICRFLVGLTRTRKCCYLMYAGNFAGTFKRASVFISWIDGARLHNLRVDAQYWKDRAK